GGLIRRQVRGPAGMRIEENEKRIAAIEQTIRGVIPASETETMLDVLGTPYSGINLSLSEGAAVSPADAQILIALKPGHRPTADYRPPPREGDGQRQPAPPVFFPPA